MENAEDDEDLKLFKASATLLSDLEACLPQLLWRRAKSPSSRGRVHTQVKQRDLDHVLKLVRWSVTLLRDPSSWRLVDRALSGRTTAARCQAEVPPATTC